MRKRARGLRLSRRMTLVAVTTIVALIAGTGTVLANAEGWWGSSDNDWPYNQTGFAPVLATVGDISCQPGAPQEAEKPTDTCDQGSGSTVRDAAQNATAAQVEAIKPALVAVLGDEQYQNGYYSDFENSYNKYWGATGGAGRRLRPDRQRLVLVRPGRLAPDLAERRVRGRAGRLQPDRRLVRERDKVAGPGPEPGPRAVHPGLLASADLQLDGQPVHLR